MNKTKSNEKRADISCELVGSGAVCNTVLFSDHYSARTSTLLFDPESG